MLFGRYDIVARPETIALWAHAWGVTRVFGFDRGHSLALFAGDTRTAYARLLDEDLRALGR